MKNYIMKNKLLINKKNLYRYERKFLINSNLINNLKELISFASYDFLEKFKPRQVNSLYYDDYNFNLGKETINGISERKKVRIRYYGRINIVNSPNLEIKNKLGNIGKKNVIKISEHDILKYNFSISELRKIYKLESFEYNYLDILKPKLIVSYNRQYFVSACDKFRFTLDTDIKFKTINRNIISESLNNNYLFAFNKNIIEFKYGIDHEMEAFKICQNLPARLSTCSKYIISLKNLGLI